MLMKIVYSIEREDSSTNNPSNLWETNGEKYTIIIKFHIRLTTLVSQNEYRVID